MATLTFTITTTDDQDAAIQKATEWRAHRNDKETPVKTPLAVPVLTGAQVKAEARSIMLQFLRSELKADLLDLRRAIAAADAATETDDVNDLS